MTIRLWAYLYDPATAGLILGASRVGVGVFGGSRVPNPMRLGYSLLGASRLGSSTNAVRQWVELDADRLSSVTYTRGLRRGVPYVPDIGTATATWLNGGGDPDLHPGLSYGTAIAITGAASNRVLWAGRLDNLTITTGRNGDSLTTWHGVDAIADFAATRWPKGMFTSIYPGPYDYKSVMTALIEGPWWTPPTSIARATASPPGQYEAAGVTPGADPGTTVQYADLVSTTVGATWWANPQFDPALVSSTTPAIARVSYAHALDPALPAATLSDAAAPSYSDIVEALNTDDIINRFELTAVINPAFDTVVSDATSVATYGPRTSRYKDGSIDGSHPGASAWLRLAAAPPTISARDISLNALPSWLDIWAPIDVLRAGRLTRARIGHITHTIRPDRRYTFRHTIRLRLLERPQ